jgi:hypothetical protein
MTRDWNAMADDEFRSMLRSEFEDNYPAALRFPPRRLLWHEQHDWYLRMSEMGWIAPNWPARHGGMGLSPAKMLIFLEEQERCGIARFQDHGIRMIGPVLLRFGTPEQQQRFLPPILRCDHRYCQGYSEPDSGSDLASLRTTARRAGDAYIVTGTKIWTTMAHDSTHMFLLARTGHDGPKQRTISFFLLDLASPGVTVRTIRDMAGQDELCEVVLDGVAVPADNLVGEENEGWTVAKSVLGFERVHVGSPQLPASGLRLLESVIAEAGLQSDAGIGDRVAALHLDVAHLSAAYRHFAAVLERGEPLGPEVSMLKLWATETFQRVADLVVDVAGPAGGAIEVLSAYYRARPSTIYGGSSEIQRNILAKQVLGLPTG